ncbi:MAG: hypothetical protein II964_06485, partial [Synergistaceae bacterium]|nr:hypothetical protein [Synergistaceae bacterium]
IYMQDENLTGWHKGLFGRTVQHSVLGLIKEIHVGRRELLTPPLEMTYNARKRVRHWQNIAAQPR